jgi:hypothetical protein
VHAACPDPFQVWHVCDAVSGVGAVHWTTTLLDVIPVPGVDVVWTVPLLTRPPFAQVMV